MPPDHQQFIEWNTQFNCYDIFYWEDRYVNVILTNEEQSAQIDACGVADGITTDIFDTKTRKHVVRGIPEYILDVSFTDVENQVVIAAAELVSEYEKVDVCQKI